MPAMLRRSCGTCSPNPPSHPVWRRSERTFRVPSWFIPRILTIPIFWILLLMNVAWSKGDANYFRLPRTGQHDLLAWFMDFKSAVGVTLDPELARWCDPRARPKSSRAVA